MSATRRASRLAVPAPAYLNPIELLDYTRLVADEVAAGRYPYVQYDEAERWHQRLYRDQRVDVWLISWLPTQGTQLHDHGGSAGAFTVLSGRLDEAVYQFDARSGEHLRNLPRDERASVGFGPHYVHDVRNLSDTPAVSVHAYSPPLTTMSFFDLDDNGRLQTLGSLATDDPEPSVELTRRVDSAA
jgi:predicted metal-dependent enzyme (double-stranded beta helix superfamily)